MFNFFTVENTWANVSSPAILVLPSEMNKSNPNRLWHGIDLWLILLGQIFNLLFFFKFFPFKIKPQPALGVLIGINTKRKYIKNLTYQEE